MGLITGLLTVPLAPVRGTAWIAEVIQTEAEKHGDNESAIVARMAELDALRETGEVSEEEIEDAENELLERLIAIRGMAEGESDASR